MISCNTTQDSDSIARVNNTYLGKDAVKKIIPEGTSAQDSAALVQNYIKKWATETLFVDRAQENLTDGEVIALERLVSSYKKSLFIKKYKDALVGKLLDTTVTDYDVMTYYTSNKANFNLNKELLKVRYLHLDNSYTEIRATRSAFIRYNKKDQAQIEDMKYAYKASSLNDSIWIEFDQIIQKVPILGTKKRETLLNSNGVLQLKDSLGVYLIKIEEVLRRNETAPLEYIAPMIRQIILNKRKLEVLKKLETDITKDAIKNEEFEIYQ